jgi:hypothetical protein
MVDAVRDKGEVPDEAMLETMRRNAFVRAFLET